MNEAKAIRLRHKAHRVRPLLQLGNGFTVRDIQEMDIHDEMSPQNWIRFLFSEECIKKQERIHCGRGDYIYKWRWVDEKKQYLQKMADRNDGLPCGCRGHIPPEIDSSTEKAPCKHCGTIHSKETFKEAL